MTKIIPLKREARFDSVRVLKEISEDAFQNYDRWKYRDGGNMIHIMARYAANIFQVIEDPQEKVLAFQVIQTHQRLWEHIMKHLPDAKV